MLEIRNFISKKEHFYCLIDVKRINEGRENFVKLGALEQVFDFVADSVVNAKAGDVEDMVEYGV